MTCWKIALFVALYISLLVAIALVKGAQENSVT
jgi:hypothetical protein